MKKILFLITIIVCIALKSQYSTDKVPISSTNSSNANFNIKSISYDDSYPTLRGESIITSDHEYEKEGIRKICYMINRSFDLYDYSPLFLAISNDGRKIVYIKNEVSFKGEEHKNVTYYVDGKFVKAYDTGEFINCDRNKEKCDLFYNNTGKIIDYRKSNFTVRVYKDDVDDKEKFLNKNFVFNRNDTIYVIDSRKKLLYSI